MATWFAGFSRHVSKIAGPYLTFIVALGFVILWAVSGPFFGFTETWQLVINTSTTIVTFLMVFVLQSTQNRDADAVHVRLDEIIIALDRASNRVLAAEDETEEELDRQRQQFVAIANRE